MPSTYTTRLRAEKQADGENSNTWGSRFNTNTADMFDAAIAGMASYALSGSKTLTSNNGAADEARMFFQNITGGTGGTVTIPNVEKVYLVRNASSGDVIFTTGSGTTATVKSGFVGMIACTGGNIVYKGLGTADSPSFATLTLTGGQIAFPATAVPSADANTLDDYEEGTFTPAIAFGGGTTGITYGNQVGRYTKIGRKVTVDARVTLTAKGSSTGSATVTGLPFTSAATAVYAWGQTLIDSAASLSSPIAAVINSVTVVNLYNQSATGFAALTEANFTDTTDLYVSVTYVI